VTAIPVPGVRVAGGQRMKTTQSSPPRGAAMAEESGTGDNEQGTETPRPRGQEAGGWQERGRERNPPLR